MALLFLFYDKLQEKGISSPLRAEAGTCYLWYLSTIRESVDSLRQETTVFSCVTTNDIVIEFVANDIGASGRVERHYGSSRFER